MDSEDSCSRAYRDLLSCRLEVKLISMKKEEKYKSLLRQVEALLDGETDLIAKMSNVSSMIHQTFGFWWTGFYRVCGNELILGPFQGPIACMHIPYGKGVCGAAWKQAETIVVSDVEAFPGHIACSSASKSEIVVPVKKDDKVIAVLDIDSERLNTFDDLDREYLEQIVQHLSL